MAELMDDQEIEDRVRFGCAGTSCEVDTWFCAGIYECRHSDQAIRHGFVCHNGWCECERPESCPWPL